MTAMHYGTLTEGRNHFPELLDAAEAGRPATVTRGAHRAAVVDAARLQRALGMLVPAAEMVAEGGGWSVFIRGLPLAADGGSVTEALEEMVLVLREYSEDWSERLLHAPNHSANWGLVQFVDLSTDTQLMDWLTGQ